MLTTASPPTLLPIGIQSLYFASIQVEIKIAKCRAKRLLATGIVNARAGDSFFT